MENECVILSTMTQSHYQAFVFDMDGTITDSIKDMMVSVNQSLAYFGYPTHDEKAYMTFIGDGSVKLIERALGKENLKDFDAVFRRYYDYYHVHFRDYTKPFAHLAEALDYAKSKGIRLFVYTNKPEAIATEVAESCFGKGYFDKIIGIPLGGVTKPDPRAYWEATKDYGIPFENQAYFGDSVTDILTAHNIGIDNMYSVLWGYQDKAKLMTAMYRPKAFLDEPGQIRDVVDGRI